VPLPDTFLADLKARVGLADIVGRRVRLVRSGREVKGCCPFHNEKTPSFHVFDDHYHCFGCGAHGDAIRWMMDAEGQDFMGAVRALADMAGMEVPEEREDRAARDRAAGLYDLMAAARDWFHAMLLEPAGAEARAYLKRRGVDRSLAAAFGLGWAPGEGLLKALTARFPGATPAQFQEAGLAGDGGRERFRGRLMFPIADARGRVVGFGGRLLGPGEPKYLNSADGPLFHKGRLLFNLARAAPVARKSGRLLLVEGYMDVIGLARAGIAEAVAPLGTALTEDQMALAWRLVPEPVLAFDGDAAGQRAAVKAALRALPHVGPGKSLAFALLPAGQDPDDLARAGGAVAVESVVAGAVPLERFLFEAEAAAGPLDTPERRSALRARLRALAREIADPELARDYRQTWAGRADALLRPEGERGTVRRGPFRKGFPGDAVPVAPLAATRATRPLPEFSIAMLLKAFAVRPEAVHRHAEALAQLPVPTRALEAARDALLDGQPPAGLDVQPLVEPQAGEGEFDQKVAAALASYIMTSQMPKSDYGPGLDSDEAVAAAMARAEAMRAASDERRNRMTQQVLPAGRETAGQ
jgi:DNA primase